MKFWFGVVLCILCFTGCQIKCENSNKLSKEKVGSPENLLEKEKADDIYEKGYNLPIEEKEKIEAENDCKKMMEKIQNIYKECDKGTANNVAISDETSLEMLEVLKKEGYPICYYNNMGMYNYDKMEKFLNDSLKERQGNIILYKINLEGGIIREKFTFDGQDMYSLYVNCTWSEDNVPVMGDIFYNRMKEWDYTEKGWFCYEVCVPEPPEVTEVVDGNCMVRVKPVKKEYRDFTEKYLLPLGYQGNNLLCSNWDAERLKDLDYNGLYEYLYLMKYKKKFEYVKYISGEEFESLIMEYLPVSAEQLRQYAVYDSKKQIYAYARLGCMNYSPRAFDTSIPEVTDIKENKDGSISIKIDAVCEKLKNDSVMSHILIIKTSDDGKIQYLGNQVIGDGLKKIPSYQYRVKQ